MLDYLWPARQHASVADEIAALEVPAKPLSPKALGKRRASDANSMPPPALILPDVDLESEDEEDDATPTFPAPNSIQRIQSGSLDLPPSTQSKPAKPRRKVVLEPGHSQLDWARLKASGANLRGDDIQGFLRVTPTELAKHRKRDDAWAVFNGKVYNITPYLKFHPGGVGELMRSAGKDGTELFMKTHAWISIEGMLGAECCIGWLARE